MTNELFERELQNTSINDVSLADYVKENYVSRSGLEQIRDEIEREADYQDAYVNADIAKGLYMALEIIDKQMK